jgi:hypothetical protein
LRPNIFVRRKLNMIAHMQTVVPVDAGGEMDLTFKGITAVTTVDHLPQSARAFVIRLTHDQHKRLEELRYKPGDHQGMLKRIHEKTQARGDRVFALVLATDMAVIRQAINDKNASPWQDLLREIISDGTNVRHA